MNIFITSINPVECAQALDDLRLNKMIIETGQLLSTALNYYNSGYPVYKSTHINHPCSVWTRTSNENYLWLIDHFNALSNERHYRFGKSHKTYDKLWNHLIKGHAFIPKGTITPFANCTPHKTIDTIEAYKLTLKDKWAKDKRPPKWTNRGKPSWA